MKVELLCLDSVIKPSSIYEGVMEIRIINSLQGIIPDNMSHMIHEDTKSDHSSWRDQGVGPSPTSP
jgi:hypothetical protein